MARISRAHHVFRIKHLLRKLGHRQCTVLLGSTRGKRCKARHEEVQTWERNQVDRDLAEVAIQLPWEPEAGGDAAHGGTHQMVEVAVRGRR